MRGRLGHAASLGGAPSGSIARMQSLLVEQGLVNSDGGVTDEATAVVLPLAKLDVTTTGSLGACRALDEMISFIASI